MGGAPGPSVNPLRQPPPSRLPQALFSPLPSSPLSGPLIKNPETVVGTFPPNSFIWGGLVE